MKVLYSIMDKMEDELGLIAKKPELSPTDVEMTYKMIDIVKDIETIDAMKNAGYSQANSYMSYEDPGMAYANRGNSYRSYDNGGNSNSYRSYDDYSQRRGRDSMGRYTSRDGYSGHDKESMIEGLREKMHMATSESDRDVIRRAIDILEK